MHMHQVGGTALDLMIEQGYGAEAEMRARLVLMLSVHTWHTNTCMRICMRAAYMHTRTQVRGLSSGALMPYRR